MHHDGRVVTACEGEAVRYPWVTCPGATALVGQLAGMPLAPNSTAVGRHADVGEQCTHLFDLAGLGVAHAWAGRERRDVRDRRPRPFGDLDHAAGDGARRDATILAWTVDGDTIVAPEPFAGRSLRSGFMAWAEDALDTDTAEAAIVLRRATMISWGRAVGLDDVARRRRAQPAR